MDIPRSSATGRRPKKYKGKGFKTNRVFLAWPYEAGHSELLAETIGGVCTALGLRLRQANKVSRSDQIRANIIREIDSADVSGG